jgi:signal transduction histidine kinase
MEVIYSIRRVSVRIRDNGTGIDPDILSSGRTGHWGLSGMRERAKKIGAKLEISSRRGAGTEIELVIPVKALSLVNRMRALWRQLTLGGRTSAKI